MTGKYLGNSHEFLARFNLLADKRLCRSQKHHLPLHNTQLCHLPWSMNLGHPEFTWRCSAHSGTYVTRTHHHREFSCWQQDALKLIELSCTFSRPQCASRVSAESVHLMLRPGQAICSVRMQASLLGIRLDLALCLITVFTPSNGFDTKVKTSVPPCVCTLFALAYRRSSLSHPRVQLLVSVEAEMQDGLPLGTIAWSYAWLPQLLASCQAQSAGTPRYCSVGQFW